MSEDFRAKIMELAEAARGTQGHQVWNWEVLASLKGRAFLLTLVGLLLKEHDEVKRLNARVDALERSLRYSNAKYR